MIRFSYILFGLLAMVVLTGCGKTSLPQAQILSYSPDEKRLVYFVEDVGVEGEGFGVPGWYVLRNLADKKERRIHYDDSWFRHEVVWLENGGVGLNLDGIVVIADKNGEVEKRLPWGENQWYALNPAGKILVTEGIYGSERRYMWNPQTNEQKELRIVWNDEEKMGPLIQITFAPTGTAFAAIAGSKLALFELKEEKGGAVLASGRSLFSFEEDGETEAYFNSDMPCMLSWTEEGTAINIPCQRKGEVYFDLPQQKLVWKNKL